MLLLCGHVVVVVSYQRRLALEAAAVCLGCLWYENIFKEIEIAI